MTASLASRVAMFIRSLLVLAVMTVALPIAIVRAAEARFGGWSPVHGLPRPDAWSSAELVDLVRQPLTEVAVADVVIRLAMTVAWTAVVVFAVTVVAELVHMIVHGGLHLPDLRGLGLAQRGARFVAVGLLAILPMINGARAAAERPTLQSLVDSAPSVLVGHTPTPLAGADTSGASDMAAADEQAHDYVVAPGDSVYGIAVRLAGPAPSAIADYADRLLDLNLGRDMGGGRRFDNAALIDVGWVLHLPSPERSVDSQAQATRAAQTEHVVVTGETLWSIADDTLGDGTRWPDLFDANRGRVFGDGASLTDPSLIRPGWELAVPGIAPLPPPVVQDTDAVDALDAVDASEASEAMDVADVADVIDPTEAANVVEPVDSADASMAGSTVAPRSAPADHTAPPVDDAAHPGTPPPETERITGEQVWVRSAPAPTSLAGLGAAIAQPRAGAVGEHHTQSLLSVRRAAMLASGVLVLLACRRRRRLQAAAPRARIPAPTPRQQTTERSLRQVGAEGRVARVARVVPSVASELTAQGRRVVAIRCSPEGAIELIASDEVTLAAPWQVLDVDRRERWCLAADDPIDHWAGYAGATGTPCPALVQLGVDDRDWDVYVDLEAVEAIEVGGSGHEAQAIVTAVAAALAASPAAEVVNLISVGIDGDAFLGHRLHRTATHPRAALELAQRAIGSTSSMAESTFALRATDASGEQWEPAVVLIGRDAGAERVVLPPNRKGVGVVSATPIHGPSATLSPDGPMWQLRPLGLRFHPIGLGATDIADIASLVDVTPAGLDEHTIHDDHVEPGDELDHDLHRSQSPEDAETDHEWVLMVRLLGPVTVVDRGGQPIEFDRSKARELLAWLSTHRDRSTRTNARTALWEQDVRDATFANVVSEARRALARAVPPAEGEEWIARTMSEALPLHPRVVTDAEIVERALATARRQPPVGAIATLAPVLELIGGLPFEGTTYLWPDAEGLTSQLVLLATTLTSELACHYLSVGDVEGVFRATGRGLRVLPGHEELIALRMRAHARAGDHAGVRQEWESYERLIDADPWSDGEPSPKLVELRHRLLRPTASTHQS